MTPEFYLKCINPPGKAVKRLYELDIVEKRGKVEYRYQILWPGNSLAAAKREVKTWAKAENVNVLSIREIYVESKPVVQQSV
jgi:hypothetical protein